MSTATKCGQRRHDEDDDEDTDDDDNDDDGGKGYDTADERCRRRVATTP